MLRRGGRGSGGDGVAGAVLIGALPRLYADTSPPPSLNQYPTVIVHMGSTHGTVRYFAGKECLINTAGNKQLRQKNNQLQGCLNFKENLGPL